jgi:methylphosphotriester-DNA--protein-cysteine methyltransferase
MKGKTKQPKVAGFMRAVLAENLRRLMDQHYKESRNRPKALAQDAGVSLSTVQRILSATVGATIDNIEAIAAVFHLSTYQLLLPSLSVMNPQIVQGATKEEERLYRNWRRAGPEALTHAHQTKTGAD